MNELACVRTFPNRAIAEIARGALLAEGIPSSISAEDTAYDITLATGGARLLVAANLAQAARGILAEQDPEKVAPAKNGPIRFSLRTLFALMSITALAATGYAYDGAAGSYTLVVGAVLIFIGVQVLRSLEGRQPMNKFFVAVAGCGLAGYGLMHVALLFFSRLFN